jgi:2-polyprenyl-3-methyl-5-hydroxy-6-metoxy-1,4-benzoquinol methylase
MGKTNVRQASALVSQCDLLICPDSGLSHVAGALETPFLALFGPIHSDLRLRYMPSANVIQSDVKCGPCFTHGFHETFCPLGGPNAPCMWNITPDEVFEKAVNIMEQEEKFEIPSIKIIEDKAKECIFCEYENPRQVFRKADCEYYQCINCKSLFLHNDPNYDIERYNSRYIELGEEDKCEIEQLFNYDQEKIQEFLEVEKGNVLELGVGNAYYLSLFKNEGWNVKGIEISDAAIEQNKKEYDIDLWKLNILKDDVNKFEDIKFDVIVVRDFLEHFKEQEIIWKKINSWLKEDGIVVFSSASSEIIKKWNESKYVNTPLAGQHKSFLSRLALEILAESSELKPRIFEMMQNNKYYFVVSKDD